MSASTCVLCARTFKSSLFVTKNAEIIRGVINQNPHHSVPFLCCFGKAEVLSRSRLENWKRRRTFEVRNESFGKSSADRVDTQNFE